MHETGIVRNLVRKMVDAAEEAGAVRVSGAEIWLGALSQFSPTHFKDHFDDDARGTIAAGARLAITLSDDVSDANAQHVMIRSLELDIEDAEA